jgi:TolA-binding protein
MYFKLAQDTPLRNDRPTSQATINYTKAIQKCAYIIEEYPNSKWVDDALFLLGRCFFYRGNSFRQAIETFEELIKKFPDSEFAPQAHFYIVKSFYMTKAVDKAKALLTEFILNQNYKTHHPTALLLLANYLLEENNFVRSEQYLSRIIQDFPQSKEYSQAYLLLGKNYLETGNHVKSNEILTKLTVARVDKYTKLQARYLMAQNFLAMRNFKEAITFTEKLIHEQYSEVERAKSKLILARSYAGAKEFEKAKVLFLLIVHENPRSVISAEAYFYLGEMYFRDLKDYPAAIEYYNNVRKEFSASAFLTAAMTKSSIAGQMVQYRSANKDMNIVNFSDQQFKLAEYFIFELNFPDSALVIYNEIIDNKSILLTSLDSLNAAIKVFNSELIQNYPRFSQVKDSVQVALEMVKKDTLIADSTRTLLITKMQQLLNTTSQKKSISEHISLFSYRIAPFALFSKIWLYHTFFSENDSIHQLFQQLKTDYPESEYTFAAEKMLTGQEVQFTTLKNIRQTEEYQSAIDLSEQNPKASTPIFESIIQEKEHIFFQESLYLLGYLHFFELSDSTAAKTYLDSLIHLKNYKEPLVQKVARFYNGEHFRQYDTLQAMDKYKILSDDSEDQVEKTPAKN